MENPYGAYKKALFLSNFFILYVLFCALCAIEDSKEDSSMYIAITGDKNNSDVYIKQSYRKENGRTSSRIYKKLGKFNDLLAQFNGDEDQMLAWAKNEAKKETALYNQKKEKSPWTFLKVLALH